MAAVDVDLFIEAGADWPGLAFPIFDEQEDPADLTGCSAYGEIRLAPGEPLHSIPLFTWSTDPDDDPDGLIVLTGNLVIVSIAGAISTTWTFQKARYDLKLTDPGGAPGKQTIRVAQGRVNVSQEVTRNGE